MKKALKPAGFKPETSRLLGIYANTKHNETTFSRFSRLSRRENHLKSKTHKVKVRYSLTLEALATTMTSWSWFKPSTSANIGPSLASNNEMQH